MSSCCQSLTKAGLQVLEPGTEAYTEREASYFSRSSQLKPYCYVQPRDAAEVAVALTTLVKDTTCNFAIRSGGGMVWAGANNIDNGVTIDLGLMNQTEYDPELKIAKIGGGSRWSDVYRTLEPFNVTVAGGRASEVGVGGFLTGGGNNYFSAKYGFGCDNVVNFEVVLASGEIVNANAQENPDLFKALKGGSGNFGIVTRFDMAAIEGATSLWGGAVVYPADGPTSQQHIAAFTNWVRNAHAYPAGTVVPFWAYTPSAGEIQIIWMMTDTSGREWTSTPAMDEFCAIEPRLASTLRHDSLLNMTITFDQPRDLYHAWSTMTFKNDARVMRRGVQMHAELIAKWKAEVSDPDFTNYLIFQPMPRVIFEHAVAQGGNVLGMDPERLGDADAVLIQTQMWVKTPELEAKARELTTRFRLDLQQYSVEVGSGVEWEYINYADQTQDPIRTYGAANVAFMRDVSARYDPEQVFQKRARAGFKLPSDN
ncbi:hypothetical protein PG996_006247 [Apiospora saccharicola]|uniref:FAD-binding PCMH-type domain-containing protein n=1 Tax=Apiospora saccharicola TaxID=335842 RepID=A0ABR1VNR7_9PEZI